MLNCFGRTLNKQLKLCAWHSFHEQKLFSVLCSINHSANTRNNRCKLSPVKINSPVKLSTRQFSLKEGEIFFQNIFQSITNSQASGFIMNTLIEIHDFSGLPWWGTILATTAALKIFLGLPLGVYQQYLVAKLKLTNIELKDIAKNVKEQVFIDAKRGKWSPQKANIRLASEIRKHWKILVVKNNCHPFKTVILSLTQLPIWVLLSLSLRKFSIDVNSGTLGNIVTALEFPVGGVFWNPNLTIPDGTLILPTIIAIGSLFIIELNVLTGSNVISLFSKIITNFLRSLSVLSFFISANVPSCVSLYWATSVLFTLATNLLLLSPKMRRFCKIPVTPTELERPYNQVATKLSEKVTSWSNIFAKK